MAYANRLDKNARVSLRREYGQQESRRRNANNRVYIAVRDGRLIPERCLVCGASDVQAHHWDYDQPLSVIWLCPEHHGMVHGWSRIPGRTHKAKA